MKPLTLEPNQLALATVNQGAQRLPVTIVRAGANAPGFYTVRDRDGTEHNIHRTNLMPVESVPLRYRRATFERYAHVIGAALRSFPQAVSVDPSPLTAESYAQPLRDSITAKKRFGYRHQLVDDALFTKHAEAISVRIKPDGTLEVGGTSPAKGHAISGTVRDAGSTPATCDSLVDLKALDAVCLLLHERRLMPAPSFVVAGVDDQTVASFEERYDVAFVPHENGRAQTYRLVPPLTLDIRMPV